jgi:hypothetical protein
MPQTRHAGKNIATNLRLRHDIENSGKKKRSGADCHQKVRPLEPEGRNPNWCGHWRRSSRNTKIRGDKVLLLWRSFVMHRFLIPYISRAVPAPAAQTYPFSNKHIGIFTQRAITPHTTYTTDKNVSLQPFQA